MTIWLSSDWHFNHPYVARLRGYETAEEHDAELIDRLNASVRPTDTLWFLGDLNMKDLTGALEKVDRINGTKHIVFGNHDAGHPMHRRAHTHQRRYLESFASTQTMAQLRRGDERLMLSHFPYYGDHPATPDRHVEWRLNPVANGGKYQSEYRWLAHGHVHDAFQRSGVGYNVGVDFAPVTDFEKVLDVLTSHAIN